MKSRKNIVFLTQKPCDLLSINIIFTIKKTFTHQTFIVITGEENIQEKRNIFFSSLKFRLCVFYMWLGQCPHIYTDKHFDFICKESQVCLLINGETVKMNYYIYKFYRVKDYWKLMRCAHNFDLFR